jgi:membrane protease subunit (stomatin/prohibitin family)
MAQLIAEDVKPAFKALGLELDQFVIESISLPDALQDVLDQRIGVNLAGDLNQYTQFEAAQALKLAAANSGGAASMGVGLGAGAVMAQTMMHTVAGAAAAGFCQQCGKPVPERARFCPECGKPQ